MFTITHGWQTAEFETEEFVLIYIKTLFDNDVYDFEVTSS